MNLNNQNNKKKGKTKAFRIIAKNQSLVKVQVQINHQVYLNRNSLRLKK